MHIMPVEAGGVGVRPDHVDRAVLLVRIAQEDFPREAAEKQEENEAELVAELVAVESGVEKPAENGAKEERAGVENFLVFGNGLKRKQDIRRVKGRSKRKREERKRPSRHLRGLRVMPITAALLIIAKTI